jgi:NTP pyrophosphatase (non-canonical NTP hydrolase)
MSGAPTIADLQARLAVVLSGLRHPPLGAAAALAEETGELSKLLVDHYCYGKPFDKKAFGDELADVFICLSELASLHDVDLQGAVTSKIDAVARKADGWRASLGSALKEAWRTPYGPATTLPPGP